MDRCRISGVETRLKGVHRVWMHDINWSSSQHGNRTMIADQASSVIEGKASGSCGIFEKSIFKSKYDA
jgi:nitrous oxide reductase accessory protein NosL